MFIKLSTLFQVIVHSKLNQVNEWIPLKLKEKDNALGVYKFEEVMEGISLDERLRTSMHV